MSMLRTDHAKGAAMLRDLPVLPGDVGLGEVTASLSCCRAFLGSSFVQEQQKAGGGEQRAQGSTCKASADEGGIRSKKECFWDAILAGGVNLGLMSS